MMPATARTKWCPFAMVGYSQLKDGAESSAPWLHCNRVVTVRGSKVVDKESKACGSHCIADECMAWRWDNSLKNDGYCGLAK